MTVTWDAVNGDSLTVLLLILIAVIAFPVGGLAIYLWRTRPQVTAHQRTPDTQPIPLSVLFPDLDALADDLASRPRIGETHDGAPLPGTLPPVDVTQPLGLGTLPPALPPQVRHCSVCRGTGRPGGCIGCRLDSVTRLYLPFGADERRVTTADIARALGAAGLAAGRRNGYDRAGELAQGFRATEEGR